METYFVLLKAKCEKLPHRKLMVLPTNLTAQTEDFYEAPAKGAGSL